MKELVGLLGAAVVGAVACNVSGTGSAADAVVLDVRCEADADCPSGFECETETEHGVDTSYCVSHDEDASGACPAGYELEEEHGGTFCKPHGGSGKDGEDASSSASGSGASCVTDADCAATEECEVETEHGATTGSCKLHSS